jgi:hypothetical protein
MISDDDVRKALAEMCVEQRLTFSVEGDNCFAISEGGGARFRIERGRAYAVDDPSIPEPPPTGRERIDKRVRGQARAAQLSLVLGCLATRGWNAARLADGSCRVSDRQDAHAFVEIRHDNQVQVVAGPSGAIGNYYDEDFARLNQEVLPAISDTMRAAWLAQ